MSSHPPLALFSIANGNNLAGEGRIMGRCPPEACQGQKRLEREWKECVVVLKRLFSFQFPFANSVWHGGERPKIR